MLNSDNYRDVDDLLSFVELRNSVIGNDKYYINKFNEMI